MRRIFEACCRSILRKACEFNLKSESISFHLAVRLHLHEILLRFLHQLLEGEENRMSAFHLPVTSVNLSLFSKWEKAS